MSVSYGTWFKSREKCPSCKRDTLTKRYVYLNSKKFGKQIYCKRCGWSG